jgi:hypothetical protein
MNQHPAYSLTKLIKHNDLSLSPSTLYKALTKAGVLRDETYLSTTGSGAEKSYRVINDDYLDFGQNVWTAHEFKTEPRFYAELFPDLVVIALQQIAQEIEGLTE